MMKEKRIFTEEHRRNLSIALTGRKLSEEHKEKVAKGMKGNTNSCGPKSEEHRYNMSVSKMGEKNPNWRGGISFDHYCHRFNGEFKDEIRKLHNNQCFLCGTFEYGRSLSVHHVNYDKQCMCNDISCEFIPLCASCHAKTNTNRVYWQHFFAKAIRCKTQMTFLELDFLC